MEFTNEIFFNKPLIAGNTVIITYNGQLYREHSKDVSIVFGYGDNWSETDSAPMVETNNGFEVTLTIKNYNTFNFCFNNSFNIWDNNYGFNYIAPISQEPEEPINGQSANNTPTTDSSNNINNDIEESSYSNEELEENSVSDNSTNEDSAETDNISNFENKTTSEDIEALFSSLLDSILDGANSSNETIDISNLSGFGLQSIDEINEEDMINCDEIFAELFEELSGESNLTTNIPSESAETQVNDDIKLNNIDLINTIEKNENEAVSNNNAENETDIEIISNTNGNNDTNAEINNDNNTDIGNDIQNQAEPEITNFDNYDFQELDTLMDNLLMSITENKTSTENATPVEKIETQDLSNENVDLPATLEDTNQDWVDKIINASYNFSKKFSTACKKLGNIIKLKAKEFGLIGNKK